MGSGHNGTRKRHLWLRKHVIWCKDRQNRCNRCGDIASFQYFQDGGCPPSWICRGANLGHLQTLLGVVHRCAKFGWNRCSRFDTVKVLVFRTFGLKTPIQAPKIGVFGLFTPKFGAVAMKPPKGIFGCENTSFGAQIVKIGAIVAEILRCLFYTSDAADE